MTHPPTDGAGRRRAVAACGPGQPISGQQILPRIDRRAERQTREHRRLDVGCRERERRAHADGDGGQRVAVDRFERIGHDVTGVAVADETHPRPAADAVVPRVAVTFVEPLDALPEQALRHPLARGVGGGVQVGDGTVAAQRHGAQAFSPFSSRSTCARA